jgi:hypothetical protein
MADNRLSAIRAHQEQQGTREDEYDRRSRFSSFGSLSCPFPPSPQLYPQLYPQLHQLFPAHEIPPHCTIPGKRHDTARANNALAVPPDPFDT